jgi:hypothetical protein
MTRSRLLRGVVAAALVATAATATPAAAKTRSATGLHDARYCEILELRGLPPTATATVWNTIGQNRCPAPWWDAFQAGPLAQELGATAVVLNGPRHFLMDSAAAITGGVRDFHGQRLRKVATIPLKHPSDIVRVAYTERTIDRTNTWSWKGGRRVFELVAPNGVTYVMQSYSQIVDKGLTLAALPALGSRLKLPTGWRYRSRVVRRPLVLRAAGSATILQDELQNTYQRVGNLPAGTTTHTVHVTGAAKTVGSPQPGTLEDRGTATGTPFGAASATLVVSLAGGHAMGTFLLAGARGSVRGTLNLTYVISGNEITFDGSADITGGTGAYRHIRGQGLKAHDHNTLDGQSGTFSLDGEVAY